MMHGLAGRRIALAASGVDAEEQQASVRKALEDAGAQVDVLPSTAGTEEEWHGARYAGLVLVGSGSSSDGKLTQLVREFLLSEKPIAAAGSGRDLVRRAGGEARVNASDDTDSTDFATRVVAEFAQCLEDRDVDEMSEQSFPASDPPATTPGSTGTAGPEHRPARP